MTRRLSTIIAVAVAVCLLAAIIFAAYATARGVPLFAGDASVFLPQTIPFHQRGELINAVWKPASDLDGLGQGRMVYHGFLYPMLLSTFMGQSDYPSLARVLGTLHGATTILFGIFLWNFAKRWGWNISPGRLLLIVLLIAACANYIRGPIGRPELLATLLLLIVALLLGWAGRAWHGWIAGVGIGMLTAIDPVIGAFAGVAFAAAAAWWLGGVSWFRTIFGTAGWSVVVFACFFLWYPYSFADWWDGTIRMARYAFADGERKHAWSSYLAEYLWSGSGWFLVGALFLVLWSGGRLLRRQYREGGGPASPVAFYAMLLLAAVLFSRFVLYASWAKYNILPFMPLGFLLVFHELGREPESRSAQPVAYRWTAIVILAIASLGFAGDLLDRVYTMRTGVDLAEARRLFSSIRKAHPDEVIALPESLFTLTEDYSDIIIWTGGRVPATAKWLVAAQFYSGRVEPPRVDGFKLVENYFNPQRARVFGMAFSRGDRGSGFAVYSREAGAATAGPERAGH